MDIDLLVRQAQRVVGRRLSIRERARVAALVEGRSRFYETTDEVRAAALWEVELIGRDRHAHLGPIVQRILQVTWLTPAVVHHLVQWAPGASSYQALTSLRKDLRHIYRPAGLTESVELLEEAAKSAYELITPRQELIAAVAKDPHAHAELRTLSHPEIESVHVGQPELYGRDSVESGWLHHPAWEFFAQTAWWRARNPPNAYQHPEPLIVDRVWTDERRGQRKVRAVLLHIPISLQGPECVAFMLLMRLGGKLRLRATWNLHSPPTSISYRVFASRRLTYDDLPGVAGGWINTPVANQLLSRWEDLRFGRTPAITVHKTRTYHRVAELQALIRRLWWLGPEELAAVLNIALTTTRPLLKQLQREAPTLYGRLLLHWRADEQAP